MWPTYVLIMSLMVPAFAWAQPPVPPAAPQPPQPPQAARPARPPEPPEPPRAPEPVLAGSPRGLPVNVQVDLTITDQVGGGTPEKKIVSLITSDASWGRIRARAQGPTTLNVDARPTIEQNTRGQATTRIRVDLTLEYTPIRPSAGEPSDDKQVPASNLHQSLSVLLTSGVPVVVSQAADPITDRRVVVEVTATVMK